MSKVHKVGLFILDVNEEFRDIEEIIEYLTSSKYAPSIHLIESETKEFEWDDDVIINKCSCTDEEYEEFFKSL